MKALLTFAMAMFVSLTFAQKEKKLTLNEETNLIDVVYYHNNGEVSQTGSFTLDGKLEGNWISYDKEGNKLVSAYYSNGKKVGKWIHWVNGKKKFVNYNNNVASL
ncbi:toxin-antitoxin system YwqK family antitoxin [Neotamlana laminarinivorans]|uniref:Nicotinic acid mononucleotide adenyltransferase n=1 Tax=Neotamlana laminarinivorans TaxID=2883124 RepID=A0A9X1L5V2_9FLAO|nr:nicotinic acid mononucleotide adenyltransferase [Tamlana laminarinivorans]MCB4799826.1 nicotinic acid mononucleotide adenyltransferase [Tamlana laminarinivorans]